MTLLTSDLSPNVFYLTEKAKKWAETAVRDGKTCEFYLAGLAAEEKRNYLLIHPDEDAYGNIPESYDGMVIQYPPTLGN